MKQILLRILSMLCAVTFVCSAFVSATYAWDNEQQVTNSLYGSRTKFVAVELYTYEKQVTDSELAVQTLSEEEILIPDTTFYLFKSDGTQIGGRYVTDSNGKVSTSLPAGSYYFEEVTPNIAYTYDREEDGTQIKKYPFLVTEQDELVIVKAYNIRLKGDLLIRKTVEREDGSDLTEEQLQTSFTFTVTFSDGGTYDYRIDEGDKQVIASGGTLQLCHGQSAVFTRLPRGVLYDITETPDEAYRTESTGSRGNITDVQSVAQFTNCYMEGELPDDVTTTLTVTKKLTGEVLESDRQKAFAMTLIVNGTKTEFALKADESRTFEIPAGAVYIVREQDYFAEGFNQTIEHGVGTADTQPIEVTVTNAYVGKVKVEISGVKTWNMGTHPEVSLPESITLQLKNGDLLVEEKTVTADEQGLWKYTFVVTKYDEEGVEIPYTLYETPMTSYRAVYDGYNITNVYCSPIVETLPVITKTVVGENTAGNFEFALLGEQKAPMPEGSNGNLKHVTRTGGGEVEMGQITFTEAGTYVYSVYELNRSERGWKYDSAVYTITYTVTEKNDVLFCEREILKNQAVAEKIEFVNTYQEITTDEKVDIYGKKIWIHGDNPAANRPDSIVILLYADGTLVAQRQVTAEDNWQYHFQMPLCDASGNRVTYTIDEEEMDDYQKQIDGYDVINTYIGTGESTGGNTGGSNPKTGDDSRADTCLKWMLVSGIGLVILVIVRRKDSRE